MARNTALSDLLIMCHNELGYNSNSTTDDVILTGLLNNKQIWYSSAFDWPFLRTRVDVAMIAGQRFYTLPDLDYERPYDVQLYWNTIYRPMVYGIKQSDYNFLNSLLSPPTMVDPPRKWLIISNVEGEGDGIGDAKFEVWPIPATSNGGANAQYVCTFIGQQKIPIMDEADSVALLDDLLLVKAVCGAMQAKRGEANASITIGEAEKRFTQLQSAYPQRDSTFRVGECKDAYPHRWKNGDNVVLLAPG